MAATGFLDGVHGQAANGVGGEPEKIIAAFAHISLLPPWTEGGSYRCNNSMP